MSQHTTVSTNLHIHNGEEPMDRRIRTRHYNYHTWATAAIEIDGHETTVFLHSIEAIREMASKLQGLSESLFAIANEQELIARAKEQAAVVG